jgi:hypothetical protein
MTKKYFRADEYSDEIYASEGETFSKGWSCGWHCGDDFISYKEGHTTYIYSHPHQGKTVFVTEALIHLAKNKSKNICIYSPEMGNKKDITWNLIQVYTGKRLYGKGAYKITTKEIDEALSFIKKHFVILEHNPFSKEGSQRFTVKDIFNQVHLAQKDYGIKIDVLCIDPFNLLDRELEDDKKQIADYVLSTLGFINSASKTMKMHTILVAHLAGDELIVDKDTGIEYMPKPHESKLAGGQSFWRAGFQMIGLWRPPYGVVNKRTGFTYPENCLWILVQKSKPFGVGKVGQFELFYDLDTHTLYETDKEKRFRCGQIEASGIPIDILYTGKNTSLQPSVQWSEPLKSADEQLEAPF